MAPKSLQPFIDAVKAHRAMLNRVIERGGVGRLKEFYDHAQADLAAHLHHLTRAGRGDEFTAQQHRIVLSQVRLGQAQIAHALGKKLSDASRDARIETVRTMAKNVTRLEKHFTGAEITVPVEEAAVFARAAHGKETSLIRVHQSSFQRYGATVTGAVEQQLGVSLLAGENTYQAIERVQRTADNAWWQAERIARTELSYAANVAHVDATAEVREDLPDLEMRWTEMVDDATGAPLDDRVAVDSLAMHGQVAPPGGLFTMPAFAPHPDAQGRTQVPRGLVGRSWTEPPDRPNDRSFLSDWRPHWGIKGWRYSGGGRMPA